MDLDQLLCGLRDCATRYRINDRDERPLQDAFFRAERLDDSLLEGLAAHLQHGQPKPGPGAAPVPRQPTPEQRACLLRLQDEQTSLLADLRGPSLVKALAAADLVVGAWAEPFTSGRGAPPNWGQLAFGSTFLLRCAAPMRFPVVALAEDLLVGSSRGWTGLSSFLKVYHQQVEAVQRVAEHLGLQDAMRLHDGMQQMSRCMAEGACKAKAKGVPACQGSRLDGDELSGSRRQVLKAIGRHLQVGFVKRTLTDLEGCMDRMLPSERVLAEGLRVLGLRQRAGEILPEGSNLLDGLENGLRSRLVGAAKALVREAEEARRAEQEAQLQRGSPQDFGPEGGMTVVRRRRRRRAAAARRPFAPSARQVAEVIFTPKTLVQRLMKLRMEDALKRARGQK